MEKAPLLIFIAASHYFRLPVFNEIFKILLGKILFQKKKQTNVWLHKTLVHSLHLKLESSLPRGLPLTSKIVWH